MTFRERAGSAGYFLKTWNSFPHASHRFSQIFTIGTPRNLPSHATMVVSDHLDFTFSLPHGGHFAVPGMFRIIMIRPPLLNDVVVDVDLSFDQLA
jgi:hypothetical protein